jgi:hypothetical protein
MTENVFSLNTFFMAVQAHLLITSGTGIVPARDVFGSVLL